MVNEDDMLGLIMITVVCCAVGTSIVWVVIIYQTRRRLNAAHNTSGQPPLTAIPTTADGQTHLYLDTSSQHSKDSGTGDSTNPSSDQLQLCLPGALICIRFSPEKIIQKSSLPFLLPSATFPILLNICKPSCIVISRCIFFRQRKLLPARRVTTKKPRYQTAKIRFCDTPITNGI